MLKYKIGMEVLHDCFLGAIFPSKPNFSWFFWRGHLFFGDVSKSSDPPKSKKRLHLFEFGTPEIRPRRVRRVSNKDDLGNALFILSPRFGICFVTNVHDCMKDVLEGVVLDGKDAFDSEDGASQTQGK